MKSKRPIDDAIDVIGNETVGDKRSGAWKRTPGQKHLEVVGSLGGGQFAEDTDEIGVGIDATCLAGFDERLEIGTGMGARHGIGEEAVAAVMPILA